jgi:hypothetical protein
MHAVPMCRQFSVCVDFQCGSRHGKDRTRCCLSGSQCAARGTTCSFLYPDAALPKKGEAQPQQKQKQGPGPGPGPGQQRNEETRPCLMKALCINTACVFVHPPERPPVCARGAACRSAMCQCSPRLHPLRDLDKVFMKKAPPGFGITFSNVKAARALHKQKLVEVSKKSFQLLQAARDDDPAKRREQEQTQGVLEAQALELQTQLRNFDQSVMQCLPGPDGGESEQAEAAAKGPSAQRLAKYRIAREVYRLGLALPALALRSEVEESIMRNQFVVIQGATDSGECYFISAYCMLRC